MYRIIDGRATGKTSRLLLLAKENNGTIVCSNPAAMRAKSLAYGIVGIDCISYGEFMQQYRRNNSDKKFYIDELEIFLKSSFCTNIDGYTLSLED